MPIVLECPNGHKSFVRDEHAGKKALCPICRAVVPVPDPRLTAQPVQSAGHTVETVRPIAPGTANLSPSAVAPPIPLAPTGAAAAPGPLKKDGVSNKRQALDKVHLGLSFHYARLILLLISVVTLIGCAIFSTIASRQGKTISASGFLAIVAMVVTAGLSFVQPVLGIVGSIYCMWVPAKSGAKGFVLASLILDVLALPAGLGLSILSMALHAEGEPAPLKLIGLAPLATGPMGMASWVLFIFFLRRLAYYLKVPEAGDEALRLVLKAVAIVLLGPIALVLGFVILIFVWWIGIPTLLVTIFAGAGMLLRVLFSTLEIIGRLREEIRPVYR